MSDTSKTSVIATIQAAAMDSAEAYDALAAYREALETRLNTPDIKEQDGSYQTENYNPADLPLSTAKGNLAKAVKAQTGVDVAIELTGIQAKAIRSKTEASNLLTLIDEITLNADRIRERGRPAPLAIVGGTTTTVGTEATSKAARVITDDRQPRLPGFD